MGLGLFSLIISSFIGVIVSIIYKELSEIKKDIFLISRNPQKAKRTLKQQDRYKNL
jgi:hypothetical protein